MYNKTNNKHLNKNSKIKILDKFYNKLINNNINKYNLKVSKIQKIISKNKQKNNNY